MKWLKSFFITKPAINSDSENQLPQKMESPLKFPSIDFAFNNTKEQINAQFQSVDSLDAKANFAIGAATGVVSAALVLQSLLLPTHLHTNCAAIIPVGLHSLPILIKRSIPLLPLLITYLIAVIFAFYAYRANNLYQAPSPSKLLENVEKTEQEIKPPIFRAMVEAYNLNNDIIDLKAKYINRSLGCLVLETMFLVLLVIYQVGC